MVSTPGKGEAETRLAEEVAKIVDYPLFRSSPTQRVLLQFLAKRAIARQEAPTQTEIAIEALGRRDDYDPTTDSSVRVQVSRLRKNLWRYYATYRSPDDLCVHIPVGQYELRLASRERAYPDTVAAGPQNAASAAPEAGPTTTPAAAVAPVSGTAQDTVAGVASPSPRSRWLPQPGKDYRIGLVIASVVAAIAIAAAVALWQRTTEAPARGTAPTLALQIDQPQGLSAPERAIFESFAALAQRQIDTSLVTDAAAADSAEADYVVEISTATLPAGPYLLLRAVDASGAVVLRGEHPLGGDAEATAARFLSDILFLTSPNGVIALREVERIGDTPMSPYQCFIAIENRRGDGGQVGNLLDDCRRRFPDSRYEPYWLARLSFAGYQSAIRDGGAIDKRGAKWTNLQKALDLDPFNPFATMIAAKVEFANGNCAAAQSQTSRALNYGQTYPTLIAAASADLNNCPDFADSRDLAEAQFERIADDATTVDPLLGLYLVIASISLDRADMAWKVAGLVDLQQDGAIAQAAQLLARSVRERGYFAANRSRVTTVVAQFVWGEAARRATIEWLVENGGREPPAAA